jgi:hypothetical protein
VLERILRNEERLHRRVSERSLRQLDLVGAERRAVRLRGVHLVRTAIRDVGSNDDEARTVGLPLCGINRAVEDVEIVDVGDSQHLPPVGLEPLLRIVAEGELGVALDRDVIVVVEPDQLSKPKVAGERCSLVRHSLHHVAVARDEVGVVIDDRVILLVEDRREMCLCHRHPDRVAHTLTEWSGGRLHAGSVTVLGMAGRPALPLPEVPDVIERDLVAREVEQAVEEHRRVARREDEPVAVRPVRIGGIVAKMPCPQHVPERSERHRGARVARVRGLDSIHGEDPDGVDREGLDRRGGGC